MKTLMTALFLLFFLLPAPAQAEEGFGGLLGDYLTHRAETRSERKAAEKRRESALKRREYVDEPGFESSYDDDPFERKRKKSYFEETKPDPDDRYIKLQKKKPVKQFDTWGRDGGQHKTSEEILQELMSPAK